MCKPAQFDGDLWRVLSAAVEVVDRLTPRGDHVHSTGRIARVYLWAVFHERPVYWACRRGHWLGVKPPRDLPNQSTMSRRLRRPEFAPFLERVADEQYRVEPLNVDERPTADAMMKQLAERDAGAGYVLADANYDSNALFDAADAAGR